MSRPLADAAAAAPVIWPDRAARFYAAALDGSDYGAAIGAALRRALPAPRSLLDLGAGAGHPVLGWLPPDAGWTALEPSRYLRARLGRLARRGHPGLLPLDARWQEVAALHLPRHNIAFCANIGGTLEAPRELLALMRAHARRALAWVVPAQRGPRRWCLAGALPAALHGEDTRPGLSGVLEALGPAQAPTASVLVPWTFRARFAGLDAAVAHCMAQLAPPPEAACRAAIAAHLAATAARLPCGGVELAAPKLSALLIWNLS
jgi:hypothetical protein